VHSGIPELTQRRRGAKAQKGKEEGAFRLVSFSFTDRRFFAALRHCVFALKIQVESRINSWQVYYFTVPYGQCRSVPSMGASA